MDSRFFNTIKWEYLTTITNLPDIGFLKMKVDELYQKEISGLLRKNDEEYADLIQNWKDSAIFAEVQQLIDDMGLQEFEYESLGSKSAQESELRQWKAPQQENARQTKTEPAESINIVPEPSPNPKITEQPSLDLKTSERPLQDLRTERRTSLELIHNGPISGPESLSRAASVSTSNVNVITKAEVTGLTKTPTKTLIKNRLKFTGFKLRKKTVDLTTKPSPASIDRTKQSTSMSNRRVSLVGENLPMYIRQQLSMPEQEESADKDSVRVKSPETDSFNSLSNKPSRINNLLANSQSLYSHSKDVSSQNHTSNTSLYDNDTTSDNDKEYILPNLFTKYYGDDDGDSNVDAVIKGIEDMGDAEFVNVGGSSSIEEEEEEEEEEEPDYLFSI